MEVKNYLKILNLDITGEKYKEIFKVEELWSEWNMKLLCLHGYGTSAVILKQQLSSIFDVLGKDNEYIFLDGEIPVEHSGTAFPVAFACCHLLTQTRTSIKSHVLQTLLRILPRRTGRIDSEGTRACQRRHRRRR